MRLNLVCLLRGPLPLRSFSLLLVFLGIIGLWVCPLFGENATGELVGGLRAERGTLLFSDDFERSGLGDEWIEHFHKVFVEEGSLVVSQMPDEHPAIVRHEMSFENAIFDFDVRFVETKRAVFVVNGDNIHIFHVAFRETQSGLEVGIQDYVNGRVVAMAIAPKKEAEDWYPITLTLLKDRLEAIVDGASIVTLRSPGLTAGKDLFQLNGVGARTEYDNVQVWSVSP